MRLVIDATSLSRTLTGIEYYTQNLILALLSTKKNEKLTLIVQGGLPRCITSFSEQYDVIDLSNGNALYNQVMGIPLALRKIDYDVVHFPAFPPSPFLTRYTITVHDANVWAHPETLSWKGKVYFSPLLKLATKRARAIVTVSEFSKNEISKYTGMSENIKNLYQTVPKKTNQSQSNKINLIEFRKLVGETPYVISVGSLEPRKNIKSLILGMKVLWEKYKVNHNLVLVGRNAWGDKKLKQEIKNANLTGKIIITGYVDEGLLDVLYHNASVFAYSSIYEGFGLPLVEAMYHNVPICCSDIDVFHEIAGESVGYFNPNSIDSIAHVLFKAINSNFLSEKKLEKLYLPILNKFTFEKIGLDYWDYFRNIKKIEETKNI